MNIVRPTLILDKEKCLRNIQMMSDKAKRNKLIFRPHFKTHQSAEIGNWFKDFGVNAITVSSVEMAEYFARSGWEDITIAFPFNVLEIDNINILAEKNKINITVSDLETVEIISDKIKNDIGVFLKIDTGAKRTGLTPEKTEVIEKIIKSIERNSHLDLKGFLTHSGHTYNAISKDEILEIHDESRRILKHIKEFSGKKDAIISIGDTPSCSIAVDFNGVDEIRPGNFVFYDLMQLKIGSCNFEQIAVTIAAPVCAKHKERNELIVHCGAIHLSKDFIIDSNGIKIFGAVVKYKNKGWETPVEDVYVKSLSQEHGIIKSSDEFFNNINIGDVIGIVPVHSCLAVSAMKKYITLEGEAIKAMC